MKILLIEDQEELADSIRDYLKEEGIICESCSSSFDAQDKMLSFSYDCILLDIMLPDGNGLDLIETIKTHQKDSNMIRGKLELLMNSPISDQQAQLIEAAYLSNERLTRIVSSLSLLAKLENQEFEFSEKINFSCLLNQTLEEFGELIKKGLIIKNPGPDPENGVSVFLERFKKGKKNSDSIGLGLSIVQQICWIHGYVFEYSFESPIHRVEVRFH